jgi:hypothetical protein
LKFAASNGAQLAINLVESTRTLRAVKRTRDSHGDPLMNALPVRRPAMKYRDHEIRYDSESEEFDAEQVRQQSDGKQYRAKRSAKPSRRRIAKPNHPGFGIAGRRNRRWAW